MLLDSTILIDFLRGNETAVNTIRTLESTVLYTTEVNVFEIVTGTYAEKSNKHVHLEKFFALLSKIVVLPLDRKSSLKAGEIAGKLITEGKQIQETDCLIAGIALANGITQILTANKNHFERIPELRVISY